MISNASPSSFLLILFAKQEITMNLFVGVHLIPNSLNSLSYETKSALMSEKSSEEARHKGEMK